MCERESVCAREFVRERKCVCQRERERVCVSVCVRESVTLHQVDGLLVRNQEALKMVDIAKALADASDLPKQVSLMFA